MVERRIGLSQGEQQLPEGGVVGAAPSDVRFVQAFELWVWLRCGVVVLMITVVP